MILNLASLLTVPASRRPKAPALVCGERSISYGALLDRSRRAAAGLAGLGVRRGQHVALMLSNVPEFSVSYFAAHHLGAAVVPLSVQLTPEEIAWQLADAEVVALIAEASCLHRAKLGIERAARSVELVGAGEGLPRGGRPRTIEDLETAAGAVESAAPTAHDDTAVILYTSGTTGRPKGAELTHFNLFRNAEVVSGMLGLGEATVGLCALPLFHSFGQTVVHNTVLMRGGCVVLQPRFESAAAVDLIQSLGVNFFAGVPTMYIALRRAAAARGVRLWGLKRCVSGGAPLPVEVLRGFDAEHGVDVRESYGLSETSPVASLNRFDRPKVPGSIGLPIDEVEFRLLDGAGLVIEGARTRGEIGIRGPNVMKGYYRRPAETAAMIQDGWLRTGDIGERDEEGYYYIVDRLKDMILRAGYSVYPREVEEILYGHPAVAEAAVVGMPDEEKGEEIKAVIVLRPGAAATAEDIMAWCRERLAAYKRPRRIEFRDALPKGPSGKILKRELR